MIVPTPSANPPAPASTATTCAYGLWPSPISAAVVAAGASPLSQLALGGADGSDIFWLAGRASEGGRTTLLRQRGNKVDELTPQPLNVRNRVHEYGGGAYAVDGDQVYFSDYADNRVYLIAPDQPARPLSPAGGQRYADFVVDRPRRRLIGVRELHPASGASTQPSNTICALGLDGQETVLASSHDFYAAPRLSPDGRWLAWLTWDHPRMPWQGSELWLAEVQADGTLASARLVAGGASVAICQPEWSPAGVLHFVSDMTGWWNLYRLAAGPDGSIEALYPMRAEFAGPHWTFGVAMYGFRSEQEIVCTYIENGVSRLARLLCDDATAGAHPAGRARLEQIASPYQEIRELRVSATGVVLLGGSPSVPLELAHIELASATLGLEVLARSISGLPADGYLSSPTSISYPSSGGRHAHAFFYAPHNQDHAAPAGSLPPVIVISHGGPTSMATSTLKLPIQFWTSRGFAVLDVNYGGSSGFGRAYRDALRGQWGVVDVDDCIAGTRYLVAQGLVDGDRLIIRGASAGGLTTLCALTFHDVFKVGASYYGVSDLQGLDDDSHKFESHYTDYLIAPASAAAALYQARSPINNTDRLNRPVIFFQGLDDRVVPPQQSEMMVAALRQRGVPVAYMALEGEGHGFRRADNIIRTLEAELYFYLRVLGLAAAGPAPAVHIDNLPA